jgi:hypothetical protein
MAQVLPAAFVLAPNNGSGGAQASFAVPNAVAFVGGQLFYQSVDLANFCVSFPGRAQIGRTLLPSS